MKTKLTLCLILLLTGCANVSTTRFRFESENTTLIVEMPKELETKNLKVHFDAKQGTVEVVADSWSSRNKATIDSQAAREKAILENSQNLVEKVTEGAVKGAMKGAIPVP